MTACTTKLTYFDIRGLGELPRLIFAFADKPYEDKRVVPSDWTNVKESCKPFNQLPLLEIDGEVYPQSGAISLYLARECGLYPKGPKEQLIVDIVLATLMDVVKIQGKWFYLPEGPDKEKSRVDVPKETAKFLVYFDELLAKNGTGYFIGNSLSLADLALFDALTGYHLNSLDYSEEKYPNIAKNMESVLKNERIANYVAKRPASSV